MKKIILFTLVFACGILSVSAQQDQFGERLNKRDYDKLKQYKTTHRFAPVTSADLKKYCPAPVHQIGPICFAYASAYYGRTILYNITVNETKDPSKNAFSYGFMALLAKNEGEINSSCKGGSSVAHACDDIARIGAVKLISFPSVCPPKTPVPPALSSEAAKYRVVAEKLYEQCTVADVKIAKIKSALADQTPVLFGLDVPNSFPSKNPITTPDLWTLTAADKRHLQCDKSVHAMCIVGFDDNRYGGTFEIVNSWGPGWKNKGFTYISYQDLALIARYAVRIRNVDPVPAHHLRHS
jgi:hypothetical protein